MELKKIVNQETYFLDKKGRKQGEYKEIKENCMTIQFYKNDLMNGLRIDDWGKNGYYLEFYKNDMEFGQQKQL